MSQSQATPSQPDADKPTPEPWDDPNRPRPLWAPYELPNSAIRMIEGEQLLHELGVREIVAGLGSASVIDFQNGLQRLKAVYVDQYEQGFKAGQESAPAISPLGYMALVAVFVKGVTVGASVVGLISGIL